MRKLALSILFFAACSARHAAPPAAATQAAPIDVSGFEQPESALHDPDADVYLVSNIAGSPFAKDGRGFISRVDPNGRVLAREWIAGLDAPKGLALQGDVLFVADLTIVRRFDRRTGAALEPLAIEGATFLNDVSALADGVAISDSGFRASESGIAPTGTDAIYRIGLDGQIARIASGSELNFPNGLTALEADLLMAPFGAAKLLRFGADGGLRSELALPTGQLDGIAVTERGCVLVSSLEAGGVLRGRLDGPPAFARFVDVLTMDIGYDAKRRRLLMPRMPENAVRILPLGERDPCDDLT